MDKKQLINNLLDIKDKLCKLNYDKSIGEVFELMGRCLNEDFYTGRLEDIEYKFEDLYGIEDYIMNMIREDGIVNTLHYYKDCVFDYDNHFKIDDYGYVCNIDESDVSDWIDDLIDELQNQ